MTGRVHGGGLSLCLSFNLINVCQVLNQKRTQERINHGMYELDDDVDDDDDDDDDDDRDK